MYVVIREMAAGNESVGEMWKETKIFSDNDTLDTVMKWAMGSDYKEKRRSRINIILTRPANIEDKESNK